MGYFFQALPCLSPFLDTDLICLMPFPLDSAEALRKVTHLLPVSVVSFARDSLSPSPARSLQMCIQTAKLSEVCPLNF